jgi:hypothetical protein
VSLAPVELFFHLTLGFGIVGEASCLFGELSRLLPGRARGFANLFPCLLAEHLGSTAHLLALGIAEAQPFDCRHRVLTGFVFGLSHEFPGLVPESFTFVVAQPQAFCGFTGQLPRLIDEGSALRVEGPCLLTCSHLGRGAFPLGFELAVPCLFSGSFALAVTRLFGRLFFGFGWGFGRGRGCWRYRSRFRFRRRHWGGFG